MRDELIAVIEQNRLGVGEQVRRLIRLCIDAEPLHPDFHQIVGLVFVRDCPSAEVSAGALQRTLGEDAGNVDASGGAIEARIGAPAFLFPRDIGTRSDHGFLPPQD